MASSIRHIITLSSRIQDASDSVTPAAMPTLRPSINIADSRPLERYACFTPRVMTRSEERRLGKGRRCLSDWSSDVCSSDLGLGDPGGDADLEALNQHRRLQALGAIRMLYAESDDPRPRRALPAQHRSEE